MNTDFLATVTQISDVGIVVLGILVVVVSIIGALQSGVLGRKSHISEKSNASEESNILRQSDIFKKSKASEVAVTKASSAAPSSPAPASPAVPVMPGAIRAPEAAADDDGTPFETEQLENYYSQVLVQSRISFWFSLVFASIGFLIIVLAAFLHSTAAADSTIARFIAGGVVDAVAALFFVQSKKAQESMADFFDKLRRDRNHLEARKLCESLDSPAAKDALRVRLALHYAEVGNPDAIAEAIIKASSLKDA